MALKSAKYRISNTQYLISNNGYRLKLINFSLILLIISHALSPILYAQQPDPVQDLLNSLTVEEKIGQLFIVPFVGADTGPGSDIATLITEYKVGGVVLQTSNSNFSNHAETPRDVARLSNQLQALTLANKSIPLFIAIDQEGDDWPYTRITGGVTPLPSPMSIGATWNQENARKVGQIVGQELAAMGINMLLGPVLDVLNEPRPTGRGDMGTRTFGGDPFWVGALGKAYIQGVHEGSNNTVATVAKHFPGRGGSDRLPDNEIATIDKSLQSLKRIELAPFFSVTQPESAGITDAMMSSHIRYRGFQGDIRQFTAPISFDPAGMNTLLQLPEFVPWREAGGLIVSDALGVPAVRKHYDPTLQTFPHRRIAREAFLAGNDLLILAGFDLNSIWSDQFENIKDTIVFFRSEYRQNRQFAAQVDASVERILRQKYKQFPNPGPNALSVDGEVALAVSGNGQNIVDEIAEESLTLLYPAPADYAIRVPRPPNASEQILIVSDTRLVKECFDDTCQPFEVLPINALEEQILNLYGPNGTGQIQPEQITSITFAELKRAVVGPLIRAEAEGDEAQTDPIASLIRHSPEETTALIQAADWIIFNTLDLNPDRYENSDALKLFLAQGLGSSLYDKNLLVFAFNSPYYLDTTEVNKLTGYFGLYSKTEPHLQVAARALFGEAEPQGASPVSVDGINYDLASALSPDPIRSFTVQVKDLQPDNQQPPVSFSLQAGPILDYNGNPVPDGTPVEFEITYANGEKAGERVPIETVDTVDAIAEVDVTLHTPGAVEIFALSGDARSQRPQLVTVSAPAQNPTPTAEPTQTPSPTPKPPTPTASHTPSPPTPTATPVPVQATDTPTLPSSEPQVPASDEVSLSALLLALATIMAAIGVASFLWKPLFATFAQRLRQALAVFCGGMLAYVLYAIGWGRPDLWFGFEASPLMLQTIMVGFVFVGALLLGFLERRFRF